ncbi:MAG: MFS transporter [Gemmataceae bacterium]
MRPTTPRLVFTLAVLLGINTMNFFDRQILGAVQEKIKADWSLSDSKLGMLGTAFILLYAFIGLPLGHLADVWRRKWLLAIGVAVWSFFTLASGFATGFWSLFVYRLGVGVGEASCAPTASSLIGDLVPPDRRARAMSLFMVGLPAGLALSFVVSAMIAQRTNSWEAAFFVAGAPGLLLAVLALFIADPPRGGAHQQAGGLPFLAVVRRVLSFPTMWWIIASGALHNFNMYALGSFIASFFKRYHEVTIEQAGQISSLVYGFGAVGIFAAGWVGDYAFKRGISGRLNVAWVGLLLAVPCLLVGLAAPKGEVVWCTVWMLLGCTLLYAYYGTVYATIQDIIEPSLRGMAMAIYFFAMYLLGAALGPVGTGWLSDTFARRAALADGSSELLPIHQAIGLRDAMYVIPILNAALVLVLFAASRTVKADVLRQNPSQA